MASGTLNGRSVLNHAFGNTTGTSVPLVSAIAGQRAGIYALLITVSAAATVTVQDTTGAALSQGFQLPANGSIALDVTANGDPWFQSQAGRGLQLALSASATVGYDVYWLPSV